MPDFGYTPVQFGGWYTQRAGWYKSTAAHNTVVINSSEQLDGAGRTTLWADGEGFSAITASAPNVYPKIATKYDRTVALVDVSPANFYVLDIFRVIGGRDHAKFFLSHFGQIESSLPMETATDYAHPEMRDFKVARHPQPGWSVTWRIEDHYKYLPPGSDVRVRYTDFTKGIDAYACQAWIVSGLFDSNDEVWVPRVMVRHKGDEGIETNYVSLIEPFDAKSGAAIKTASRLAMKNGDQDAGDSSVAMRVSLSDGRSDLIISNDSAGATLAQPDEKIITDAQLAMIRRDASGSPRMLSFCNGTKFQADGVNLRTPPGVCVQIRINSDGAKLLRGTAKDIRLLELHGKRMDF
jgi:hypothetical protein